MALFLVHRRARVSDICIGARVLILLPVVDGDVGGQSETKTHTHTHAHALFYYQPPPYPHPTTPGNGTGGRRSILRHAETAVNNGSSIKCSICGRASTSISGFSISETRPLFTDGQGRTRDVLLTSRSIAHLILNVPRAATRTWSHLGNAFDRNFERRPHATGRTAERTFDDRDARAAAVRAGHVQLNAVPVRMDRTAGFAAVAAASLIAGHVRPQRGRRRPRLARRRR